MSTKVIREMVYANTKAIVAGAFFEETVTIWDLSKFVLKQTLQTEYSFGGRRLALDGAGDRLFTGSYDRKCVSCYDVSNGARLWTHERIGQVQVVSHLPYSKLVVVLTANKSGNKTAHVLSVDSGGTIETYRATNTFRESPIDGTRVLRDRKRGTIYSVGSRIDVPVESPYWLDVAFGPETSAVSEMGGALRFVDSRSGEELWRYTPQEGRHITRVEYFQDLRCFFAVEYRYSGNIGAALLRLDHLKKEVAVIREFESLHASAWVPTENQLVTYDGQVIDLCTGDRRHTLDFSRVDSAQ